MLCHTNSLISLFHDIHMLVKPTIHCKSHFKSFEVPSNLFKCTFFSKKQIDWTSQWVSIKYISYMHVFIQACLRYMHMGRDCAAPPTHSEYNLMGGGNQPLVPSRDRSFDVAV